MRVLLIEDDNAAQVFDSFANSRNAGVQNNINGYFAASVPAFNVVT